MDANTLAQLQSLSADVTNADFDLGAFLTALLAHLSAAETAATALALRMTNAETAATALTARVHTLDGL
jgi:hypothetical protein